VDMTHRPLVLGFLAGSFALGACTSGANSSTALAAEAPLLLLNIAPAHQSAGVSPAGVVTLAFNMAMMQGMEMLVVVHEGSVTGAQVSGSADQCRMAGGDQQLRHGVHVYDGVGAARAVIPKCVGISNEGRATLI
jgi:hypothetical protein